MPSDPYSGFTRHFSVLVVALTLVTGCGKKDSPNRTFSQGNACLDSIGDRIDRFLLGDIEESEWTATFDCVADQVDFFSKYVRGEDPNGYTNKDIDAMVRKFLITDSKLSSQFVPALFQFKASLIGGDDKIVTKDELKKFLNFNKVLREETRILLPYLANRAKHPSEDNTIRFVDAFQAFGENIGKYFSAAHGDFSVSKDSFIPFAREILRLSHGDQTYVDRYGDVARNLKAMIGGGNSDYIESTTWPKLFQESASLTSILLAFRDAELKKIVFPYAADEYAYRLRVMKKGHEVVKRILNSAGGSIPLTLLDPVIDTVPLDDFSAEQRAAVKKDIRKILFHTLQGGVEGYITPQALKVAMDIYESGMKTQIHLYRIYLNLPPTVVPREFEIAAEKYKATLNAPTSDELAIERKSVDDLITLAKSYNGLFPQGSGEMRFAPDTQNSRSLGHMNRMQWFQRAIRYAFTIYATENTSSSVKEAKSKDLEAMITDFENILRAWKKVRPGITRADVTAKRFREANLFMPVSNGDKLVNEVEATYYIAFLFSSGAMSGRVFDQIVYDMGLCRPGTGMVDEVGNPAVDAQCFRNAYFGNIDLFWVNFPDLIKHYKHLKTSEQASLRYAMEKAARTKGVSNDPIGPFDMDSFAALPHYLESIIGRFDVNNDQVLDKHEVLDRAYPIFKDTLATLSGRTSDWVLEGALTYAIKFGKLPKTIAEQAHFLAWCAWRPFWKIEADRAALYQVIAILSDPIPKKPRSAEEYLLPTFTEEELATSHLGRLGN